MGTHPSWGLKIYEKLDHALVNESWRVQFPEAYVRVLTRVDYSDYHPILISLQDDTYCNPNKSFKFEWTWVLEDIYNDRVTEVWDADNGLKASLDIVRLASTKWNMIIVKGLQKEKN